MGSATRVVDRLVDQADVSIVGVSDGQVLTYDSGTGKWRNESASAGGTASGVSGAIQFSGGSGVFSSDAASLFWDDTNNRLGVGESSPVAKVHVDAGTNASLVPGILLEASASVANTGGLVMAQAGRDRGVRFSLNSMNSGLWSVDVQEILQSTGATQQTLMQFKATGVVLAGATFGTTGVTASTAVYTFSNIGGFSFATDTNDNDPSTSNVLSVTTGSANTQLLHVGKGGEIKTNQTAAATTLGTVTRRMPVYNASGTLVGYIPIYDSIT